MNFESFKDSLVDKDFIKKMDENDKLFFKRNIFYEKPFNNLNVYIDKYNLNQEEIQLLNQYNYYARNRDLLIGTIPILGNDLIKQVIEKTNRKSSVTEPLIVGETENKCINLIENFLKELKDNYKSLLDKSNIFEDESKVKNNFYQNPIIAITKNESEGIIFEDRNIFEASISNIFETFQQKKVFYDMMTELINRDLLTDDSQNLIFNFQFLLNQSFNQTIQKYCEINKIDPNKIIFLYKGGTTMKILYQKYLKENSSSDLFKYLDEFFQRSDSDYGIYIYEKDKTKYHQIFYDINIICFNILQKIKEFLNTNDNLKCIIPLEKINETLMKNQILKFNKKLEDERKKLDFFKDIDKFIGVTINNQDYFIEEIPQLDRELIYNLEKNKDDSSSLDDIYVESTEQFNRILKEKPKKSNKFEEESFKNLLFIKNRRLSPIRKDFYITTIDAPREITGKNPKLIHFEKVPNKNNGIYNYFNETNYYKIIDFKGMDFLTNFLLHRMKLNTIFYFKTKAEKTDGKVKYGYFNCPSELIDVSNPKVNDDKIKELNFSRDFKKYQNIKYNKTLNFIGYTIEGFIFDFLKAIYEESNYKPWLDKKYKKKINRINFFILILASNLDFSKFDQFLKIYNNIIDKNIELVDIENIKKIYNNEAINKYFDGLLKVKNYQTEEKYGEMKDFIKKILDKASKDSSFKNFESNFNKDVEEVPYLKKYITYKRKYIKLKNQIL
jgi:hypothetical protein